MPRPYLTPIELPGDAASGLHAVPKQQLDARITEINTALAARELTSNRDGPDGYCPLNASSKVPTANLYASTATQSGVVRLTGDLGGTSIAPTVPGLASKVPTTRLLTAGTGLTGGGDLSADRTLAVAYGSAAGTAVAGNDARVTAGQATTTAAIRALGTGGLDAAAGDDTRLSNSRTPTAHAASHARGGADPLAPSIATITYAATITPDAAAAQLHRCTATGDLILAAPTGTADGREISVEILASGAIRNLTIAAAILLTQGITTPVAVASGKRWFGALRHITGVGWLLLASTQQS